VLDDANQEFRLAGDLRTSKRYDRGRAQGIAISAIGEDCDQRGLPNGGMPIQLPDIQIDPSPTRSMSSSAPASRALLFVAAARHGPDRRLRSWSGRKQPGVVFQKARSSCLQTFRRAICAGDPERKAVQRDRGEEPGSWQRRSERKSQFLASMSHELAHTAQRHHSALTEMMATNAARFGTEKGAGNRCAVVNAAGTHLLSLIN